MNESPPTSTSTRPRPMGWLVGVAVLLITLGVIAGLVGITIVAKRKQQYRIQESPGGAPTSVTNTAGRP